MTIVKIGQKEWDQALHISQPLSDPRYRVTASGLICLDKHIFISKEVLNEEIPVLKGKVVYDCYHTDGVSGIGLVTLFKLRGALGFELIYAVFQVSVKDSKDGDFRIVGVDQDIAIPASMWKQAIELTR